MRWREACGQCRTGGERGQARDFPRLDLRFTGGRPDHVPHRRLENSLREFSTLTTGSTTANFLAWDEREHSACVRAALFEQHCVDGRVEQRQNNPSGSKKGTWSRAASEDADEVLSLD